MRAAVLTDAHRFVVEDVPDPAPRAGELVLRVRACGICGSDVKAHDRLPAGTVMGHEFCGEVVAVGADAGSWQEGRLVAALPLGTCGRCRWCQADEPAHCEQVAMVGFPGAPGGFAEYVRADARLTVPLGEVGEHGALVEPLAVGLHAVAAAEVGPGDRVLVIGGGNVGAAVAVWARRAGASEVVVSDPSAHRRGSADRFGATGVHDPAEGPPASTFDVAIECVGLPGLVQSAIDAVGARGRVAVAGVCVQPDQIVPLTAVMKEVQLRFAVYYRTGEFAAAAALLGDGTFDPTPFVTGTVGLDGVDAAFRGLVQHTTDGKVLVIP